MAKTTAFFAAVAAKAWAYLLAMFLLALAATGCSSFQREWRNAASTGSGSNGIDGRWVGIWRSDVNGHHGGLRCLISAVNEHEREAKFRASYFGFLHFEYTVIFQAEHTNDGWQVHGREDLGAAAGGLYYYDGFVTPARFQASYRCEADRGIFEMARPK